MPATATPFQADNGRMSGTSRKAVILLAHGARDARWSLTLGELARRVQARAPRAYVGQAFLELQPPTLEHAIDAAVRAGRTHIDIAPVFWAGAGHVADDVAPLLARLRSAHPRLTLTLLPVLSELPGMLDFIAAAIAES